MADHTTMPPPPPEPEPESEPNTEEKKEETKKEEEVENLKGKGKDTGEETCEICQCEFTVEGDSGQGLCCPNSHYLCSECTGVFINSCMSDLKTSFPPKCSICKVEIPPTKFEMHLNDHQADELRTHAAFNALLPGDVMMRCDNENCPYFEIRVDNPVIWCCPVCGEGKCLVCNKAVKYVEDHEDMDEETQQAIENHLIICANRREPKSVIDEALESGSTMPCPECKLQGRKDDSCTHMSCPRCDTSWCYVCGLSLQDCDKADPGEGRPTDNIYLHNRNWRSNANRCPMYLTEIPDVDSRWGNPANVDDQACLDYFHRIRTIKKLQEAREQLGHEAFAQLYAEFPSISNSGYPYDEVVETDVSTLIERVDEDDDGDDGDESDY